MSNYCCFQLNRSKLNVILFDNNISYHLMHSGGDFVLE